MKDFGKLLATFVGGALVGAAVALLTAPKSGAETRAQIIALAKEKGLYLDHNEWDAFVAKVKARLHDYFTDEELEAAVDEALADKE
ncbi:MAG: YtxH domain-containing protein [Paludibacteraceae bacterium]|nr:YtxH domain-containing protein [Paludibacteraceae bacterium]